MGKKRKKIKTSESEMSSLEYSMTLKNQSPDSSTQPAISGLLNQRTRIWLDECLRDYCIVKSQLSLSHKEFKRLVARLFNYTETCSGLDSLEDFCAIVAYFVTTCPNIFEEGKQDQPWFDKIYLGQPISVDHIVKKYINTDVENKADISSKPVIERRKQLEILLKNENPVYQRGVIAIICLTVLPLIGNNLRSVFCMKSPIHWMSLNLEDPELSFNFCDEFMMKINYADDNIIEYLRASFRMLVQHTHLRNPLNTHPLYQWIEHERDFKFYGLDIAEFLLKGLNKCQGGNKWEELIKYSKNQLKATIIKECGPELYSRFNSQFQLFASFLRFHQCGFRSNDYKKELAVAHINTGGRYKEGELDRKDRRLWPFSLFIDPINYAELNTRNHPEMAMFALGFVASEKDLKNPVMYFEWSRLFIISHKIPLKHLNCLFLEGAIALRAIEKPS